MFKKILIATLTVFIAVSGFLAGFFSVGCMSVYAENNNPLYVPLRDPSDTVVAFQYYCKSRDLTIDGSLTDAVTKFTTGAFNSACNTIGINIPQLQAELKAEYDQSGKPVKFLINSSGIMAMNRIFGQFLQDNELSVGDSADEQNNTVYNGEIVYDADGNSALVYYVDRATSDGSYSFLRVGSPYKYTAYDLTQIAKSNGPAVEIPITYIDNSGTNTIYIRYSHYQAGDTLQDDINFNTSSFTDLAGRIYHNRDGSISYQDHLAILKFNNYYYIGGADPETNRWFTKINSYYIFSPSTKNNAVVYLSTNNNVINNNNYEGDTIINNEGDIINNPQPSKPNDPNNTIHNVPETPLSPNDDGGWDIDLPDIDIPNLPLGNLSEKFPFSIPWDLVAFYAMLDAEPQAPRFNGTMDLTLVQWNYDIDLSPFDSAAELCRKLQFGLFVVGLIVASRSIIRG